VYIHFLVSGWPVSTLGFVLYTFASPIHYGLNLYFSWFDFRNKKGFYTRLKIRFYFILFYFILYLRSAVLYTYLLHFYSFSFLFSEKIID